MKHCGSHITSLLYIFLLVTIGVGGEILSSFNNRSQNQTLFEKQFCQGKDFQQWPPAKRQLCGKGVYINTDNANALKYLPNIGPERARAIIDYREVHGQIQNLDELQNIKGIGPRTVSKIKPWIEDIPIKSIDNETNKGERKKRF